MSEARCVRDKVRAEAPCDDGASYGVEGEGAFKAVGVGIILNVPMWRT